MSPESKLELPFLDRPHAPHRFPNLRRANILYRTHAGYSRIQLLAHIDHSAPHAATPNRSLLSPELFTLVASDPGKAEIKGIGASLDCHVPHAAKRNRQPLALDTLGLHTAEIGR